LLQERDDLAPFGLGLVDAGDVLERHLGVLFHEDPRAAAPNAQETTLLADRTPRQGCPDQQQHERRDDPREEQRDDAAPDLFGEHDTVLAQLVHERLVDTRGNERGVGVHILVLERPAHAGVADLDV